MNKKQRAKVITIRFLLAALGLSLGVLISAQWRSVPSRVSNPLAPYTSLKETRDSLYDEQVQLKAEITSLQSQIDKVQKEKSVVLGSKELSNLETEKALAGLTKLNGPGVIIIYDDSKSGSLTEDSIVHASDLRDTLNVLWSAGAEAISINGQRVTVNTAVDCIVNTILVNNTRISNPFRIEAIGEPGMLSDALNASSALANIFDRQKNQGLVFGISKNDDITMPVYDGSFEIKAGSVQ